MGTVAPILGAYPLSFISCGDGYAKDVRAVYLFGRITAADPNTFAVLGPADSPQGSLNGDTYTKDKTHVYLNGIPVSSVDVNSFVLIYGSDGQPSSFVKDSRHVYNAYDASIVVGADPSSFIVLNAYYAKDKNGVYSFDGPDSNVAGTSVARLSANAAAFHLVSGKSSYDATDGTTKFDRGWPVN